MLGATLTLCALAGCAGSTDRRPVTAGLQSPVVDDRIAAIIRAGQTRDSSAVPLLVERLEDRCEAAGLFAIEALERITGTRLGYNYYDPPAERSLAVARWRQWLRSPPAGPLAEAGVPKRGLPRLGSPDGGGGP